MFYYNFVDLCNKIGKSPSAVAQDLGKARSAVTRWKNGTQPQQATLQKLADYFKVPVSDLTKENKPVPTKEDGLEEDIAEIIRLFRSASPELQEAALAVLKSALKQK